MHFLYVSTKQEEKEAIQLPTYAQAHAPAAVAGVDLATRTPRRRPVTSYPRTRPRRRPRSTTCYACAVRRRMWRPRCLRLCTSCHRRQPLYFIITYQLKFQYAIPEKKDTFAN